MENNISKAVRFQCRKQGITMRQLADKMQIAPESLSRAINGNPTLSTLNNIAENLNVNVTQLLDTTISAHDLSAIVVFSGQTLVTNMPNKLLAVARAVCQTIEEQANVEEVQIKTPAIADRCFLS